MNKIQISKALRTTIIGGVVGAIGGLAYWNFIGCSSGHCAIQSVWYNSTIYGTVMGGLVVNLFIKKNS